MPFGLTEDEADHYKVLVDGVPYELRDSLIEWLKPILVEAVAEAHRVRLEVNYARIQRLEMLTRVPMISPIDVEDWPASARVEWFEYALFLRDMPPRSLLRVVDATLSEAWYGTDTTALDDMLCICKSKWMVGTRVGKQGLVAREPEGVQDMVDATIASAGTAGHILARAWGKVHAFTPDDTGAYADAVRAVEAAHPIVEPKSSTATLGTMARVIEDQGDWHLPLREDQRAPHPKMLVAMMRSLFRGHRDRHGKDDYRDVTHEEAQVGIVLAATLVSWFASGSVQRRPADSQDRSS